MNLTPPIGPGGLTEDQAARIFAHAGVSLVLTDPSLPDNPIVYVNDAFETTTGYRRDEVLGRNCRFLQGEGTDPDHRRALREAIAEGRAVVVDILNYHPDGSTFRNRLLVAPVHDSEGRIVHFLGIQKILSSMEARRARAASVDDALREIEHRVKNHLAMVLSLIRLEARAGGGPEGYDRLAERVQSLQLLYQELSQAGRRGRAEDLVRLDSYLGRICEAVVRLDQHHGLELRTDLAAIPVPTETAVRIGLFLSEALSNALRHAFDGQGGGAIDVRLAALEDGRMELVVRDDGQGLPPGVTWPDMASMGGRIVRGLVDGLGADLKVESGPSGTSVALDVPAPLPHN